MANICDYIDWRGDLDFSQSEFNEIDGLILAKVSYFPLDVLMESNEIITISEVAKRFAAKDVDGGVDVLWPDDRELILAMGRSKRFGELELTKFSSVIDVSQEKQFGAVTIILPGKRLYVSYRGTDSTVVGWKEDLNMCYMDNVPSQISGRRYLKVVAEEYQDYDLILGGHSKGGNVAIYAAAFSRVDNDRIKRIFNFDGPGFSKSVVESEEYRAIIDKVETYVPQSSVIGMLMNRKESYSVVESSQKYIMQHDVYSWLVWGTDFVCLDDVDKKSMVVDKTISEWLESVEPEKRGIVLNSVFDMIGQTDVLTFREFGADWFKNGKTVIASYKEVDPEVKRMIWETVNGLIRIFAGNVFKRK